MSLEKPASHFQSAADIVDLVLVLYVHCQDICGVFAHNKHIDLCPTYLDVIIVLMPSTKRVWDPSGALYEHRASLPSPKLRETKRVLDF